MTQDKSDSHTKGFSLKRILQSVTVFGLSLMLSLASMNSYALPQDGAVAAGNVTITTPSSTSMQINQATDKGIINWQSFNIAQGEHVHFQQPNTSSITLNNVNPSNGSSAIFGQLTANGQVWLVNPAGIWFSQSSYVNVGGLLATTASISDQDFLSGNYRFIQSPNWNGSVINQGNIVINNAGLGALVGVGVSNDGRIEANLGTVVLGAGTEYLVDFSGDQLINFSVGRSVSQPVVDQNGQALSSAVSNSGSVIANGGKVLMTAMTAGQVLDRSINMGGIVEAKSVSNKNGVIILGANDGAVHVSGKVIASGRNVGEKGGTVKVLGNTVALENEALIDVSGDQGGGEVLIGGNAHGAGPEPNAKYAFVNSDANIYADALTHGNGGKVVVWGDDATYFYGKISAKGGIYSGDGGWAETSGHYLDIQGGRVNLLAPYGETGTWLLDPTNVYITDTPIGTKLTVSGGVFTPSGVGTLDSYILNTDLLNALTSGNVIVNTTNSNFPNNTGNIFVQKAISWGNASKLTLTADGNIQFNAGMGTGGGSGSSLILNALNGGTITQTAGALISGSGTVELVGGNATFDQLNTYAGGTIVTGGILSANSIAPSGTSSALGTGSQLTLNGGILNYTGPGASANRSLITTANGGTLRISSSGAGILTLTGTQSGGASGGNPLNIDLATGSLTLASPAAGSTAFGNITVSGTGTNRVALQRTGIYLSTSTLTINSGTVRIAINNAAGPNIVLNGGTFDLAGLSQTFAGITGAAGSTITNSNTSSTSILTINGSSTKTFAGNLTASDPTRLTLTYSGTGKQILSGINTYVGPTSISSGTLSIASKDSLGGGAVGQTTVSSGATLEFNYNDPINPLSNSATINVSGTGVGGLGALTSIGSGNTVILNNLINMTSSTTFGGDGTLVLGDGILTSNGVVSGAFNLTKMGTGTLTLNGLNTYTGSTTINNGTINYNTIQNQGFGSSSLGNPSGGNETIQISNSGTLNYTGSGSASTRPFSLTGGAGSGATLGSIGTGLLLLTGNFTGTNTNLILTGTAAASTIPGIVSLGSGGVTKTGTGTWTFSAATNSFTGPTTVLGGKLSLNNNNSLGSGATATSSITVADGANLTLNFLGAFGSSAPITLNGNGIAGSGALSFFVSGANTSISNPITLVGNTLIGGTSNAQAQLNGNISGPYNLTISLTNGSFVLPSITLPGGTLTLAAKNAANSITTSSTAAINVANFNLTQGQWFQNMASLPTFNVTNNFQINGGAMPSSAQFIRSQSTTATGSPAQPYIITDVYGLQGMGSTATTLGYSYTLANNIDASITKNWNSGAGFVPAGDNTNNYTGTFNGQNFVIKDLWINRIPSSSYVGLFGYTGGASTIQNVGLINASVAGGAYVGSLVGYNQSAVSNVFSLNADVAQTNDAQSIAGGLIGYSGTNNITNAWVTGYVNGASNVGGLVGQNFSTISSSWSGANVSARGDNAGGLVGDNYYPITNAYAIGSVSGTNNVGGLVGYNRNNPGFANITNTYASGLVTGLSNVGGLVGFNSSNVVGSFFDSNTTQQTEGIGNGTTIGATPGCFSGINCSAGAATLNDSTIYSAAGWNIGDIPNPGTSPPGSIWLIFNANTRPMLASEWSTTIYNAHQLQLVGMAVGQTGTPVTYNLASNIDGSVFTNPSEVWGTSSSSGAGFLPIGGMGFDGTSGNSYVGTFTGNKNNVNLYINRPGMQNVGLFWQLGTGSFVSSVNMFGTFIGGNNTGSLAGKSFGTTITSSANVNVNGQNTVGGLIGYLTNSGSITTSYASGAVVGVSTVGGLVGLQEGSLTDVYSTASVTGITPSATKVGGLVGETGTSSAILRGYATGRVSIASSDTNIGGFIGNAIGGTTVTNGFWDTESTGQANGFGGGSLSGSLYGGCFTLGGSCILPGPNSSNPGSPVNLSLLSTYNALWGNITGTQSTTNTAPASTWFIFNGSSRPMLTSEWFTTINTAHQLQLANMVLGANYTLGSNIDLSGIKNLSEVWGTSNTTGAGFIAIGNSTNQFTGNLNGKNYAISNLYINAPATINQGLFGYTSAASTIQNVGLINANVKGYDVVGSLIGNNQGTINNVFSSNATVNLTNTISAGGLVGENQGSISNAWVTGTVTGFNRVGGLVGSNGTVNTNATINTSWSGATVISTGGAAGGLAGISSGPISNSYATGNVSGNASVGGFAGILNLSSSTLTNVYSSGLVTGTTNVGGLVGSNNYGPGGNIFNAYYDSTINPISPVGNGSGAGVTGLATGAMLSSGSYSGWSIQTFPSSSIAPLTSTWLMVDGYTRPMLNAEWSKNIYNAHQLQLSHFASLAHYSLQNNIDLSVTSNTSNVWGGNAGIGFVPIGSASFPFSGIFNGNGYTLSNLNINSPASSNVGLFGYTKGAYIYNLNLLNSNVIGSMNVGSLVGQLEQGSVVLVNAKGTNVFSTGNNIGGLVGLVTSGGAINQSSNSGSVFGFTSVGGLVGTNLAAISRSFSTGVVNTLAGGSDIGGLVGTNNQIGSGVGYLTNTYSLANVVASNSSNVGGLIGKNNNGGRVINSFSAGYVAGASNFGGLIGNSTGGIITNSYWDTESSGQSSSSGDGTGRSTALMFFKGTFSPPWDFNNIWGIIQNQSYPYLLAMNPTPPRVISGISQGGANTTVKLAVNGSVLDNVLTGANSSFYFQEANGTIADSSLLLLYLSGAVNKSNTVVIAPTSGGSISDVSLALNTVQVGQNATSSSLSNTLVNQARGSLTGVDILFSGTNNLSILSGYNLNVTSGTSYSVDGNIDTNAGSMTFFGPLSLAVNSSLTTAVSGDVTITNSIFGLGKLFSVNVAGTNSVISGQMFNLTFSKAGNGTLTLNNNNNNFSGGADVFGGTLKVTSLSNGGSNSALGKSPSVGLHNGGRLSYIGSGALTSDRQFGIDVGGGVIQSTQATLTLTGAISNNSTGANALTFDTNTGNIIATGLISGGGTLIKTGAGTLTLSNAANTYSGQTRVDNGVLSVTKLSNNGSNSSIGNNSSAFALLLGSGVTPATLSYTGATDATNLAITLGSAGGTIDTNTGSLTVSGLISGVGGLTKSGSGTLTLSNTANTYNGQTRINNGILSVNKLNNNGSNSSIGTNSSALALLLGSIGTSATLSYTGGTDATNISINVGSAGGTIQSTSPGLLTLSGTITNNGPISFDTNTGNITASGLISSTGGLTKTGSGTLTLSNPANNYSGQTNVTNGVLSVTKLSTSGNTSSIGMLNGTTALLLGSNTSSATLLYTGNGGGPDTTDVPITINGSGGGIIKSTYSGILTLANMIDNNGNLLTFDTSLNGNDILSGGIISGSGGLTKLGAGTLALSGSNTYGGMTNINGGLLEVMHASGLGGTTNGTFINNSAIVDIDNLTLANEGFTLNNTSTLSGTGTVVIPGAITIGSGADVKISSATAGSLTLNGTIDGAANGVGGLSLGDPTFTKLGTIILPNSIGGTNRLSSLSAYTTLTLGNISSNTSIKTTGNLYFNPFHGPNPPMTPVTLNGNVTLDSQSGNITLGTINSAPATSTSLTATANTSQYIEFNGDVNTTGNQLYNGPTSLNTATVHLTSTTGDISIGKIFSPTTPDNIVMNANTIHFTDAVGAPALYINNLTATANTLFMNGGQIVTTGDQLYTGNVVLGSDYTLQGDDISFASSATINSDDILTPRSLNIIYNTNTGTFGSAIGNVKPLFSLSFNSSISGVALPNITLASGGTLSVDVADAVSQNLNTSLTVPGLVNILHANNGISLNTGVANSISSFTVGNLESGNILLATTSPTLNLLDILKTGNGSISIVNAGGGNIILNNSAMINADTGDVIIRSFGDLQLNTGSHINAGHVGTSIQLVGQSFHNQNLTGTTLNPGSGRYLVWSTNPANDTRGNLNLTYNFKLYGVSYPDAIVDTNPNYSGNGVIYSITPTATIHLTGNTTKVYDGLLGATLAPSNYSITGGIDGDTLSVIGSLPNTGTYSSKNVGDGINVSTTGLSNTNIGGMNGGANVYGYTLASTSVNGNIGTIEVAPLSVTANNQTKTYGDTFNFSGNNTQFTSVGLVNGETIGLVTLASAGADATADVAGSPYTISISDARAGSFSPSNYDITYHTGSLSVDQAALLITSNDQTKVYGVNYNLGTTAFTATGLKNNETVGSVDLASAGAAATAHVDGGPFAIISSNAGGGTFNANNYNITYDNNSGHLTITPASLNITAIDQSKVYGSTIDFSGPNLGSFTTSGLLNGDSVTSVNLTSTGAAATAHVVGSPYTITASNATGSSGAHFSTDYTISYTNGTLSITPASLTITANNQTKEYGNTFTFTGNNTEFSTTGLKNSDTVNSVNLTSTGSAATAHVAGNPYAIIASNATGGFSGSDYNISYAPGELTITPASLVIKTNDQSKVYGVNYNLGTTAFTATGLKNSDTVTNVTLSSTGAAPDKHVDEGPFAITASNPTGGFAASDYSISYNNAGKLTITPASLNITAIDQSKVYGSTIDFSGPNLGSFTTSGLLNGDTVTSVNLTSAGAAGTAHVAGSPYTITASNATGSSGAYFSSDYTISYTNGALTITPASLTITANNQTKEYGNTFTFTGNNTEFSTTGLKNSDTVNSVNLTSTGSAATAHVAGNPYAISASGATGGFSASDYNISYTPGELTITPASLVIKTNDQSKVYGVNYNLGTTAFTTTGLKNSDTVTNVTLSSTGAAPDKHVSDGPFAITASNPIGGFAASDYSISYNNAGKLTITPASLNITAIDQSKVYGSTIDFSGPNLGSFTTSGLLNGDTVTSVNLTSAGAAATAHVVGSPYTITASNATGSSGAHFSSDYTINYTNGTLSITPASLTITANNQTKEYGNTFTFTGNNTEFSTIGLKNSDTVNSVNLTSTGAAATAHVAGSPYAINASSATGGFSASDYNISYAPGQLTIAPASLVIKTNDHSKVYGVNYNLGTTAFTTTGLKNSDTVTNVTLSSTGAAPDKHVDEGPFAITASNPTGGFAASDYSISYNNAGKLTITPASLSITANNLTKVYGNTIDFSGINLGFITTSGLVNGDTVTSVNLTSTGAVDTAHVAGSPYAISASNATGSGAHFSTDYTISYNNGALTITPAPLTIANLQAYGKVYNASTLATLNVGPATLTGVLFSDAVNINSQGATGNYADINVGSNIQITTNGFALAGTDANNYYLASQPTTAAAITPAPLTASLKNVFKTYDTTTLAALTKNNFDLSGLFGDDEVFINSVNGIYNNSNAGSNRIVNVSGLTINGDSANNYELITTSLSTNTATINKAPLLVTGIVADNKKYDGTTTATLNLDAALLQNIFSGDDVTMGDTYDANFVTSFPGNNISVIVNGLGLNGASADNYFLVQPMGLTANISSPTTLPEINSLFNRQAILQANYFPSPGLYFFDLFGNSDDDGAKLLDDKDYPYQINQHCVAITSLITLCE